MENEIACPVCEKTFRKNSGSHKFCSRKCGAINMRRTPEYKARAYHHHKKWCEKNRSRKSEYERKYLRDEISTHPWRSLIRSARRRANKRSIPFDLDEEWAQKRWTGKCELTRIEFTTERSRRNLRNFFPTIDKIDPKLGYIKSNCRIILWAVNSMKGDGTNEDMLSIAIAIVTNISRKD